MACLLGVIAIGARSAEIKIQVNTAAAIKATTEVTKTAFLSGFIAWAIE